MKTYLVGSKSFWSCLLLLLLVTGGLSACSRPASKSAGHVPLSFNKNNDPILYQAVKSTDKKQPLELWDSFPHAQEIKMTVALLPHAYADGKNTRLLRIVWTIPPKTPSGALWLGQALFLVERLPGDWRILDQLYAYLEDGRSGYAAEVKYLVVLTHGRLGLLRREHMFADGQESDSFQVGVWTKQSVAFQAYDIKQHK